VSSEESVVNYPFKKINHRDQSQQRTRGEEKAEQSRRGERGREVEGGGKRKSGESERERILLLHLVHNQ
jgi:hypothetical protein